MTASDTYDRVRREARTAASWLRRSVAVLRAAEFPEDDRFAGVLPSLRWLAGCEAEALLRIVLYEADSLVGLLNEDADLDQLRRLARAVERALRNRELASKLANVEGRTPEEAALFLRKAEELAR